MTKKAKKERPPTAFQKARKEAQARVKRAKASLSDAKRDARSLGLLRKKKKK